MKTILRTYSHPVLGNGDDFINAFDVAYGIEVSEDKSDWIIGLKVAMDNEQIQRLIDSGLAAYHLEIECGSTFYRHSFDTNQQTAQFTIPTTRLRGKVKLDTYIVALQHIEEYQPSDVHEDYGNRAYKISTGDILGVGGSRTFIADTEFDPLRASASSFIKIERGPKAKGNIIAEHGSSEIIIRLPQEDYDRFQEVAGQKVIEDILHAAIVFPVLVEAIQFAQHRRGNDYNDRLLAILEQRGLMKEEAFIAAQEILQAPVARALSKLQQIREAE